jgi:glutamine synthetase
MNLMAETADAFLARQRPLVDEARRTLEESGIEVVIAGASDLNGIFRGKRVPARRFIEHPLNPVHVSDYFWAMDTEELIMPREPGFPGWWPCWDTGFADVLPIPDLATLRIAPWLDRTAVVLCEHFFHDGSPVEIAPRLLLRRLVDRAAERGLFPKFAAELEFFLFRESEESLEQSGYRSAALTPMNLRLGAYGIIRGSLDEHVIRPLTSHMEAYGIPLEYWNPEGGAGQQEVNLLYCDLLEAADRAFLFKHAVKEIAASHDLMATFMAKTLPGFGSSCHIHQSLWSEDKNLCWQEDAPGHISDLTLDYIGGQVATLAEMTLLFAPTLNSYKRFQPDAGAGTTATWGFENRTCGVRVINENEGGTRVENRVPGGDVNPYLAMAGCIAGGLYGIEHKVKPPDPISHNAYNDPSVPLLPTSLEQAIEAFEASEVAAEYLGAEFVRFFAATRRWELEQFRAAVSDWEVRRYLQFL